MHIESPQLLYLSLIIMSILILCSTPRAIPIKSLAELKEKATVLLDTGRYLNIGILYAAAYLETGYQQAIWICVCCLFIVHGKDKVQIKRLISFVLAGSLMGEFLSLDPNLKEVFPIRQLYTMRDYSI